MKDFFGIVIYSIEDDGCLNGLWTTIANNGEISNEIAKKKNGENTCLTGDYIVTFIEHDNPLLISQGSLLIKSGRNKLYELEWTIDNKTNKFFGKGFIIGKQLIVSYVER